MINPRILWLLIFLLIAPFTLHAKPVSEMPPGLKDALRQARHQIEAIEVEGKPDHWQAINLANHLKIKFDGQGVEAFSAQSDWRFGMELIGVGSPKQIKPVQNPRVHIESNRLTYDRGTIQEWYINDPRGLEQGFTLNKPLSKEQLVLQFALKGDVQSELIDAGKALRLTTKGGKRLRYEGLKAWDAKGEDLEATMQVSGSTLQLKVAVADADYPITIDPWLVEEQKLTASDSSSRWFGVGVAISGNTAVVGAPEGAGSVYVFVFDGTTWTEQAKLRPLPAAAGIIYKKFGYHVDISEDTIVTEGRDGFAIVFVREGGAWTQQAVLTVDVPRIDYYGSPVAISGNTIVMGTPRDHGVEDSTGSTYVFVRGEDGAWSGPTKLVALDGKQYDYFGGVVDISGDMVLVGAPQVNYFTGSAYVFVRNGGAWSQQAKLVSDAEYGEFGGSVAAPDSGDLAVVGAYGDSSPAGTSSGSVYIFERSGESWARKAKLTALDAAENDNFGLSVAATNDKILVGASDSAGSAYLFVRPIGTGWVDANETVKLTSSDRLEGDGYGDSVAISSNVALIGAYGVGGMINNQLQPGAAYITDLSCDLPFLLPGNKWRQISLPCNPGPNNTVDAVFGDDDLGVYDTDWVLFRYDTSIDNYIKLKPTDTLSQNIGYWIIHKSGSENTLKMPAGSIPTSISVSAKCIDSSKGCFEIQLGTENNATQWNMIGYPFKTSGLLNDARVVTDSGDCEAGCTLDIAEYNDILHNVLWTYNGTAYTKVDSAGSIDPWNGYWAVTLEGPGDINPKLLVPKP